MGTYAPPVDTPFILSDSDGRKRVVVAADRAARKAGIVIGMSVTQANALVTGLRIEDADLEGDAHGLERLAQWAIKQYSPIVAIDLPNNLHIDMSGAAHLFGGEVSMLAGMIVRLRGSGFAARAAVAPNYAAAYALAHHMRQVTTIACEEDYRELLKDLPIIALRLQPATIVALRKLGFERISELEATPRAPLALRFGSEIGLRLDQIQGRRHEPIEPIHPSEILSARRFFAEPIGTPESLAKVTNLLVQDLCEELLAKGQGARRLDLVFHRVDNCFEVIRIGLGKPVRDVKRMTKLLCDKLETVDPGLGVEVMTLSAPWAEALNYEQIATQLGEKARPHVSSLIDTLGNRLGNGALYRLVPIESDVPERSVKRAAPLAEIPETSFPTRWPRPIRLLARPEPIDTVALLPDHPPVSFTWRGVRRRVECADGPERIPGEWWKHASERHSIRDYYTLEDKTGERVWVFRAGDGENSNTGSQRWYLHGVFA